MKVRRFILLLISIHAAFAMVMLWRGPDLPSSRAVKQVDEFWHLPQRVPLDVDAAVSVIMRAKLWGTGSVQSAATLPAVEDPPLTSPDWRIAGMYSKPDGDVALLAVEGKPQRELRVGDRLPGGAKILLITPDRICILLGGKKRSISTYRE